MWELLLLLRLLLLVDTVPLLFTNHSTIVQFILFFAVIPSRTFRVEQITTLTLAILFFAELPSTPSRSQNEAIASLHHDYRDVSLHRARCSCFGRVFPLDAPERTAQERRQEEGSRGPVRASACNDIWTQSRNSSGCQRISRFAGFTHCRSTSPRAYGKARATAPPRSYGGIVCPRSTATISISTPTSACTNCGTRPKKLAGRQHISQRISQSGLQRISQRISLLGAMRFPQLAATLSIISIVGALPSQKRATHAIKERHNVPRSWTKLGSASKSDTVNLQIGLAQQKPGLIEQHLLEISNPKHERYGKHLSQQEVDEIMAPSKDSTDLVEAWLRENGIADYAHNKAKNMIHCSVPISQAESLLNTTYSTYQHEDGSEVNRAPEWSLPEYLHDHIDLVQPTTSFFRLRRQVVQDESAWHDVSWWQEQGQEAYPQAFAGSAEGLSSQADGPEIVAQEEVADQTGPDQVTQPEAAGPPPTQGTFQPFQGGGDSVGADIPSICQVDFVTPQCIRTLYGTINYVPQAPDRQIVATTNYLSQSVNRADIATAMQIFRPDAANAGNEVNLVSIANGDVSQEMTIEKLIKQTNSEANLDAINLLSVAYPIPFTAYHTGGSPPFQPSVSTQVNGNEPYLDWLDYVLSQESMPAVIATSYGDDEQSVPKSYADRVCQGFAQLGARGVTVLFSSGDHGVGEDGTCLANDGSGRQQFIANFPAGCPWVTTVGSTAEFQPEVATSRFKSGAGFSTYFEMPDYQKPTVQNYVAGLNGQNQGYYNPSGRAYPDVAAQGNHDAIVWNGQISTIGGTSASAPTFGGIIALVNDVLISQGRSPLGFLNPWLYSEGYQGLTDIVTGDSAGCGTNGFPAQQGWDAVSGWGTPNFERLAQVALSSAGQAQ